MFAEKPFFGTSNHSNLHLPPIHKSFRRRVRPPPTPCFSSKAAKAAHIAENVSALKAKYTDYTTWLKSSTRHNHEPVLSQELLKNSLCQMGIDSRKAERLVSTCSWYVYQFQKDLKINPEQKDEIITIQNNKHKQYKNKIKKTTIVTDNVEDSTATSTSNDLDDSSSSNSRNNHLVLPPIHVPNLSTSLRFRRVDFGNEQTKNLIPEPSSSQWRSALFKTRLKSLSTESSDHSNPSLSIDLDSSSSQRTLRRHGLVAGHKRSILRKQISPSSSNTSTEINHPRFRSRIVTPSSTGVDDIPLGTRSQRLFGGSTCFAQIMNELEQQKRKI